MEGAKYKQMAYTINKTDGSVLTTITDGTVDNTTSLQLFGKSFSGFGEGLNENLVKLLENTASTSAPTAPLRGQLWMDTNTNQIKVYDGSSFKPTGGAKSQSSEPTSASAGDLWHDSTNDQLYVAYNPSFYVDSDGNNLFAAPQSEHSYNTSGDNIVREGQISVIANTQENILNNFINPAKFGAGYTVEIFECTAGGTTISTNKIDEFASTSTNKKHGGYAFDYKEGAVLFGVNSDGTSPNLSGYNHP